MDPESSKRRLPGLKVGFARVHERAVYVENDAARLGKQRPLSLDGELFFGPSGFCKHEPDASESPSMVISRMLRILPRRTQPRAACECRFAQLVLYLECGSPGPWPA
jgi:hypothetical protein